MEKVKKYKVDVELNGTIQFEVDAKNYDEAQQKVDDLLSNTSVKEAIKEWNETMRYSSNIHCISDIEREAR